jgi:hypothetical protein
MYTFGAKEKYTSQQQEAPHGTQPSKPRQSLEEK